VANFAPTTAATKIVYVVAAITALTFVAMLLLTGLHP
jgi:hypothetical protein